MLAPLHREDFRWAPVRASGSLQHFVNHKRLLLNMADSNREAEKNQLRSLLQEALAPETAKTASDAIRQLLQQPQGPQKRTVFLLLAEEALQGEKDELRQLAAVLLRRKIATAFGCMDPSEQVCGDACVLTVDGSWLKAVFAGLEGN